YQYVTPLLRGCRPLGLQSEILSKCEGATTVRRGPRHAAYRRQKRSERRRGVKGNSAHQNAARPRSGARETSCLADSQRQVSLCATPSIQATQRVRVSRYGHVVCVRDTMTFVSWSERKRATKVNLGDGKKRFDL